MQESRTSVAKRVLSQLFQIAAVKVRIHLVACRNKSYWKMPHSLKKRMISIAWSRWVGCFPLEWLSSTFMVLQVKVLFYFTNFKALRNHQQTPLRFVRRWSSWISFQNFSTSWWVLLGVGMPLENQQRDQDAISKTFWRCPVQFCQAWHKFWFKFLSSSKNGERRLWINCQWLNVKKKLLEAESSDFPITRGMYC